MANWLFGVGSTAVTEAPVSILPHEQLSSNLHGAIRDGAIRDHVRSGVGRRREWGVMSSRIAVLVVEDEFLIRLDLVEYLSDQGFEVFEAAHADEAIAILEANDQVHVLFTDIDMPGTMDGLRLSAAVRDRWPPVRIVATSGHRSVALTDLPEGSLFYPKPYDHAVVARSFRSLFSR